MGKSQNGVNKGMQFGGIYFLAFIGTLVYFLNIAEGVGEVFLSFLQALVWPALLMYRVFQVLNI